MGVTSIVTESPSQITPSDGARAKTSSKLGPSVTLYRTSSTCYFHDGQLMSHVRRKYAILYHIRWRGNVTNFMPHQHPIGYPTTSATTFIMDMDDIIKIYLLSLKSKLRWKKYLLHITSDYIKKLKKKSHHKLIWKSNHIIYEIVSAKSFCKQKWQ